MTIYIFVLKGNLNGENRSGAFLFLPGIYTVKTRYCLGEQILLQCYTILNETFACVFAMA